MWDRDKAAGPLGPGWRAVEARLADFSIWPDKQVLGLEMKVVSGGD